MPVPSEQAGATCTGCGAALVADQRYCLACGQPCSPVRLAFLDVLQDHGQPHAGQAPPGTTLAYTPLLEPSGAPGWLRRYSGLFGVMSVLLMALIVGLLLGHWVTQSKAPGQQVIKVEGLGSVAGASTTPASTAASTTPSAGGAGKSNAKAEAEEAKAAAKETPAEKAPPPKPVKVTPAKLKKLSSTTGKKHQEEINALGAQPIETGG
ncbi:MAG: hypothetical protein QOI89_2161 [Solirubrobacteraceae bacterium]|jgi:hypothetical protein|nr:hypothetical protein [Solirubrobacteraceae bacterium]